MGTMSLNNLLLLVVNSSTTISNLLRFTTFILKYRFANHTLYKVEIIIFTKLLEDFIFDNHLSFKNKYKMKNIFSDFLRDQNYFSALNEPLPYVFY